ncbi:NADH-quinone oxidoreductase subunit NuoE [Oscillatoria amoena NRMC-F 0135]|nr:NADH-quinone oxidoreductase subunit NuoE [Oscillatoria laete-virens]MDL5047499.1 NADH-quinone oxidoreductase subunit NuoE [Oscillatoria amoena NRMC-F 0135]MDL5054677.1 NADH-quinone oxidoreductase subunit NuoE [Oscillatoria laete-virens NRMC-F 0139]
MDICPELQKKIDEAVSHYPVSKRSAALPLLHLFQEKYGHISDEAIHWIAQRLELQPINILELVTFYPMFRRQPLGKTQIKVCRTLSCALGGSYALCHHIKEKLGLNPDEHEPETTADGKFTVEFVECIASCGTAPVVQVNDDLLEGVTIAQADEIIAKNS